VDVDMTRYLHILAVAGLAWVTAMASGPAAHAHTGGLTGFAALTVDGERVRYETTFTAIPAGALATKMRWGAADTMPDGKPLLEAARAALSLTADGVPCVADAGTATLTEAKPPGIRIVLGFTCSTAPANLVIRDDLPDALGADYHTLALVTWKGGSHQFAFGDDAREVTVRIDSGAGAGRGAGSFFPLGVEHILLGYDHLLFVLALILRGGNVVQVLKIITAFTVAHSITLGLAALDVVSLPGALVEAAIALSIAYVALENLLPRFAVSRRWAVSFLFGLIHGFGFSSVLREIGLPRDNLVLALLNFNLGVEVGQAAVVLLVLPVLLKLRRRPWEPRMVAIISSVILVVGLVLFVDRAFLGG
jgi:hypothetical protein